MKQPKSSRLFISFVGMAAIFLAVLFTSSVLYRSYKNQTEITSLNLRATELTSTERSLSLRETLISNREKEAQIHETDLEKRGEELHNQAELLHQREELLLQRERNVDEALSKIGTLDLSKGSVSAIGGKKKRRLIFSINPGRSGSGFLSLMLDSAENVKCFHEKQPSLLNFPEVMRIGYEKTYKIRYPKVTAILNDLTQEPFKSSPETAYCDSNHMFVKVFKDVVMDYFDKEHSADYQIDVVVLRRYLPLVLRSYMRLNIFSPEYNLNQYSGGEYSLGHRNVAITEPYAPNSEQDAVDLNIGYLIDFEAQAYKFKKDYPHIRVTDVRLEDLQNEQGVRKFFRDLDLTPTQKSFDLMGKLYNPKDPKNNIPQPLGMYHERITQFIEKYRQRGIFLPPLPQMSLMTWCTGFTGVDRHGEMCPLEGEKFDEVPFNVLPKH